MKQKNLVIKGWKWHHLVHHLQHTNLNIFSNIPCKPLLWMFECPLNYLTDEGRELLSVQRVMLLTMKVDNTTEGLYLSSLLYMLSMVMISDHIHTTACLYTIVQCTDSMIMNMCSCFLLVAICAASLARYSLLLIWNYDNIVQLQM